MIFLGCLFDRKNEKEILKNSIHGLPNATNTYQWQLIDGLQQSLKESLKIINVLPVGIYPLHYKKLLLKEHAWHYQGSSNIEIGSINLPLLKQYQRFKNCRRILRQVSSQDKNIIIYSPYWPFLKAINQLDSTYSVTLIVTDLPEYSDLNHTNFLKKFLRKLYNKQIYKYLKRVNHFVLLTEQMKEPLNVGSRPYVVVEGICSEINEKTDISRNDKKIILYTGTLHYQFGIETLLEAFELITEPDYELWICGGGEAAEKVKILSQKDSRIKFLGYVTKEKIYELQQQATLLINPRKNEGDYTKYSFPSKTMEYMSSGTPVLMYKLDGIPNEYDDYLYYIRDNSSEAFSKKIVDICEKSPKELYEFGLKAKEFVLKEKNNVIQAKKIINMIGGTE